MKLVDLEAKFLRSEDRVIARNVVDGDPETWRERGCPTKEVIGPGEHKVHVETLPDATGIWFLCPACFVKNGGPVGTHRVEVGFRDRGLLDHQSSQSKHGGPSRWAVSGTGIHDLTTDPSVDCGCWHGWIRNGDAT